MSVPASCPLPFDMNINSFVGSSVRKSFQVASLSQSIANIPDTSPVRVPPIRVATVLKVVAYFCFHSFSNIGSVFLLLSTRTSSPLSGTVCHPKSMYSCTSVASYI